MREDDQDTVKTDDRKEWASPTVRGVVPTTRTAGGNFNFDPSQQDDVWYSGS